MKYQIVIVWFPFYLEYLWFFSMQLKAKHSNSDNHQTMIHMTNHRPLHNNIYHYVSHHTMIAIHISVTVNVVSWGICMHVEIDIIYWYWKYMKYWYYIKYYLYSSQ